MSKPLKRAIISQRIYDYKPYNELWECLDSALYGYLCDLGVLGFGISAYAWDCAKHKEAYLEEIFSQIDMLVLSGGNDIGAYPKRDDFELALLEYALNHHKKVLGICRGMQLIARYFGVQILPSSHRIKELHTLQERNESALKHSVHSYHHFCIKDAPGGFKILAMVDDEIEAMSSEYILALMWHPEREREKATIEADKALISAFINGGKK